MTLQVWGGALLLVAASVIIGRGLTGAGCRCSAAGPGVGLAALIVISSIAIKLPGRAVTAAAALLLTVIGAAIFAALRDRRIGWSPTGLAALVLSAVGAAVPFVANGRVGLPGVSLDNDTANHLLWAEQLRSDAVAHRYGNLPPGYPLGPHSLIDALASGTGIRLDLALTGLLIAVVLTTALLAAAAFVGQAWWKGGLAGVLAALLYLPAAYYAEASFKETILGLLLLALVLQLQDVRRGWAADLATRWRGLIPVSLLFAGAIYVYSYLALAWFGGTIVLWLAAELVARPGWRERLRRSRRGSGDPRRRALGRSILALAGSTALALALLAPSAGRVASFVSTIGTSPAGSGAIAQSNVGNLSGYLSGYEALGIWNSPDFRFTPANVFGAGELSAFALAVVLFGVLVLLARRELIVPAALAASALIFWRASHGQSPYVAAKALVIPGPVIAIAGLQGLLGPPAWAQTRGGGWVRLTLAALFAGLALHSSYEALRDEPVWPTESTQELLSLAQGTQGQSVLFLGATDYASWLFADTNMSALAPSSNSIGQAAVRADKPNAFGTALDFDSVGPTTINRFAWAITTRTDYASQPPDGFRLARTLPMYQLWQRVGQVAPRQVLEAPGAPGGVLDCHTAAGRRLSRQRGIAAVAPAPVIAKLSTILPGGLDSASLPLGPGRWNISLQYTSSDPLEVAFAGQRFRMPAYLDRPGPYFAVGSVTSAGRPVVVTIHALRPSSVTGPILAALLTNVVAVRSPSSRSIIPLRQACGRYVDWYRFSG